MNQNGASGSLGDYLRQRRAALQPQDVGLPANRNARRRANGLRREEVAALAALSTDYYTRIEQGRRSAPAATLEAIAAALKIDEDGLRYMNELSAASPGPGPRSRSQPQRTSPALRGLIADLATTPAIVLGRRMDILAWNPTACRLLLTELDSLPPEHLNYVHLVFTRPEVRALYADWESTGRMCVFQLHMDVARDPSDEKLARLVGELSVRDADFRRWWSEHHVVAGNGGAKTFRHPVVGDLHLNWDTLVLADDPDQRLVTWNAAVGSESHERLMALGAKGAPPVERIGTGTWPDPQGTDRVRR